MKPNDNSTNIPAGRIQRQGSERHTLIFVLYMCELYICSMYVEC